MPFEKRMHLSVLVGLCAAMFGCSGEPMEEAENIGETTLAVSASDPYIFATFDGDGATEQKLFIFTSTDGNNWSQLSTGFAGPTGVLRDPSLIKNPNDGKWYIAYTVQSWTTQSTYFNIASSTDLYNWSNVTSVNAGVTGTAYTWAPEFYVEGTSVKVVVSLGTSSYSFTPYYYTALNAGLSSWSGPTNMGFGANHIDTFVTKRSGVYHAFIKNESTKYVEHATATSFGGPWSWAGYDNWAGWGSGKEGPAVFQNNDGSYTLFADDYSGAGIHKATSSDLYSWSGMTSVGSLSSKRHGTVWRNTASGGGLTGINKIQPSYATSMCMEPAGNSNSGATGQLWTCSTSGNPNWNIVQTSTGVYELRAANGGLCLTVWGANYTNGGNLALYACSGQTGSRWNVTQIGSNYQFRSINNTAKCIDISNGGSTNSTRVQIWDCSGAGTNQTFRVAP
jgi:hypothetical protein